MVGAAEPASIMHIPMASVAVSGDMGDLSTAGDRCGGHESARKRGKTIGSANVTDESMLSTALRLRDQGMSLRERLVITTGAKKGQHPSPAAVMRKLREHDEQADTAARR